MQTSRSEEFGEASRVLKDAALSELRSLSAELLREQGKFREERHQLQEDHAAARREQQAIREDHRQMSEEHRAHREKLQAVREAVESEQRALREEQGALAEAMQRLSDIVGGLEMKAKESELSPGAAQKLNPFASDGRSEFGLDSNYEATLVESDDEVAVDTPRGGAG